MVYFFHSIIMRIGLIMAKCGAFLACIKKYTQQFYLSHVLTSYLHCFPCSDSHVPPRSQGSGADRRCGRDRCHSGGFLLRIMPPSWHPVPACSPRLCCRRAILLCSNDGAASIPKSGPEIKNRCSNRLKNRCSTMESALCRGRGMPDGQAESDAGALSRS